jgi:site-specific recombinase XerD
MTSINAPLTSGHLQFVRRHLREKEGSYRTWLSALVCDVLILTGWSASELCEISTEGLETHSPPHSGLGVALCRASHTSMERRAFVPAELLSELREFVATARVRLPGADQTNRVFLDGKGKRLTAKYVRSLLRHINTETGVMLTSGFGPGTIRGAYEHL